MTGSNGSKRLAQAAVLLLWLAAACAGEETAEYSPETDAVGAIMVTVPELSDTARQGQEIFTAHCSECHGIHAEGSSEGPPLVHIIYEPDHHSDYSFHVAVMRGTRQHHWQFGNMEPRPEVAVEDIDKIVCYVRELQFANGIFADPDALAACRP